MTDAAHQAGSKIFLQTAMVASCKADEDGDLYEMPIDQWTKEEIREIVGYFGDSTLRAKRAGYDGVQIHAAHFFFLSRFISPLLRDPGSSVRLRLETGTHLTWPTSSACILDIFGGTAGIPQSLSGARMIRTV